MNFYQKRQMASKQGRAINHMYPTLFASKLKRKKQEPSDPEPVYDFSQMLSDLETKKQLEQEKADQLRGTSLTSSFRAVSREKHEFTTRNKSGSPKVGLYNPKYESTKPRIDRAPTYTTKKCEINEKLVFTPKCLDANLHCSFPRRKSAEDSNELGNFSHALRRTLTKFKKHDQAEHKNERIHKEIPKKAQKRIQSPIKFNVQVSRKAFVSEKDPPNDKRFDFNGCLSQQYSRNLKAQTYDFGKWEERKELFPSKMSLGFYERDEEKCMERLDVSILEFGKRPSRQDLVHTQVLETPFPVEFEVYEHAYFKQSNVRGPFKIPTMSSIVPRDDLMYRVKDSYVYNVPIIQAAEAKAQFQGEIPITVLKDKFKSNN
jgi:hypothetical protein